MGSFFKCHFHGYIVGRHGKGTRVLAGTGQGHRIICVTGFVDLKLLNNKARSRTWSCCNIYYLINLRCSCYDKRTTGS